MSDEQKTAYKLRLYQERLVVQARKAFALGARAVLVQLPTGGGKGSIVAWIVREAIARGRRVLFVVHRRELVLDIRERIKRMGIEKVAILLGGEPEGDLDALVTVASIQTLAARAVVPAADLIVTDEAHHATASTYRALYAKYPGVPHIGFTATPQRADGSALGDVFDVLECGPDIAALQAIGDLSPCDTIAPGRRTKKLSRDPVDAVLAYAGKRKTVLFCSTVAQATDYALRLGTHGIAAAVVTGKTPKKSRDSILKAWAAGDIQVVVNCAVLTEGYDLGGIEVCILARPCGSAGLYLQCVGRILRTAPGKERALLIDLFGACHEHGLVSDARTYSLSGEAIALSEKLPPLRQCAHCGATFRPAPTCPRCGASQAPTPKEIEVQEAKLSLVRAIAEKQEKKDWYLAQLAEGRRRGWKDGAAGHRYREKYGDWPPVAWRRCLKEAPEPTETTMTRRTGTFDFEE
jgi:DNA repair protein RadD